MFVTVFFMKPIKLDITQILIGEKLVVYSYMEYYIAVGMHEPHLKAKKKKRMNLRYNAE